MCSRIQKEVLRGWVKFPTGSEAEAIPTSLRPAWLLQISIFAGLAADPVESGTNSTVWMKEEYACRRAFYVRKVQVFWL